MADAVSENRKRQLEAEALHVERLLELASIAASKEHSDRPDFLLVFSDGRRVGLEHMELVDQDLKADEAQGKRFTEILNAEFASRALPGGLEVGVELFPGVVSGKEKKDLRKLAQAIGQYVSTCAVGADPVSVDQAALITAGILRVHALHLFRIAGNPFPARAQLLPSTWVDASVALQEALDKKEALIPALAAHRVRTLMDSTHRQPAGGKASAQNALRSGLLPRPRGRYSRPHRRLDGTVRPPRHAVSMTPEQVGQVQFWATMAGLLCAFVAAGASLWQVRDTKRQRAEQERRDRVLAEREEAYQRFVKDDDLTTKSEPGKYDEKQLDVTPENVRLLVRAEQEGLISVTNRTVRLWIYAGRGT